MKKFVKGTTTLLATALVFQSTPIIQAASYSQDRSNQLSILESFSPPSLNTQAVYECLTLYYQALQDSRTSAGHLKSLREKALLALDFLDNLPNRPSAMDLDQLLNSIALIRQLDESFPIYQPHVATWPKNPKPSSTPYPELEKTETPILSLLEASHQMETSQSQVVKKAIAPVDFNLTTSLAQKDSNSLSSSIDSSTSSSFAPEESNSLISSRVSQEPSQGFQEEIPSEIPFEDISREPSESLSSQDTSFQESISPLQTPIPALQEEPSIQDEPTLKQDSKMAKAIVIVEGTDLDERLTAWLSEDPSNFLSSSFEDSTSDHSTDGSYEPALVEPIPIQTIEPFIQEPSQVEEMPSEEQIVEEPALIEEADSSTSQEALSFEQDSRTDSSISTSESVQEIKPTFIPTPVPKPVSEEKEPSPQENAVSIVQMEEEVDLAPIEEPNTFSIFDYIKVQDSSSLLEVIYPGLGIGPLPQRPVAALPILFKDDLNQNPQNFEDADDVSAEGRPQELENLQGIPEYFEEMDENDLSSSPNSLPPLPSEEEEPKNSPISTPNSEDLVQMDPIVVDVSDKDLYFDVMSDFDPSIVAPAPANPLLPVFSSPVASDSSFQEQLIVDSWATSPTVSTPTPTLSQSITVRQLTKRQNRRLQIANMGIITLLPNYEDSFAWKKAASPYNTPLLWGQCTWFAWGRFYDLYGYSPGFSGNGYDCVSQLLQVHGDKFEFSKTPASGAVFSSDVAHNHVGIVLDYDAKKDLLTIQEGNLDGISNSNWDEAIEDYRTLRLSSSDIRTLYGDVTYAIPKESTKFVGYEETKKVLSQKEITPLKEKKAIKTSDSSQLKTLRRLCFEKLKSLLFIEEEMEEIEEEKQEDSFLSSNVSNPSLEEGFEWMEN